MGLSLTRMRRKVRKPIGLEDDDPDLLNPDIDEYLNISYWEVQDKFPFREKEKTATFQTIIGTRNYDMPRPFDALQSLAILDPLENKFRKLKRMDPDVYESIYTDTVDARDMPTDYVREGCFARLWPTPDEVYTMSIKRLITLDDIVLAADEPDMPPVWHEIIVMGAIWRAFLDFGDVARAGHFKNHQISLINSVVPTQLKEEADSREAGLEVFSREYDVS